MCSDHSTKTCGKCNVLKPKSEFAKCLKNQDGLQSKCKACDKAYRDANKDKILPYLREYHEKNKDVLIEKKRQYRLQNIEAIREKDRIYSKNNKQKISEANKKRWVNNKQKLSAENYNRNKERRKNDPLYAMRLRISHRIRLALRGIGGTKGDKTTIDILGCDLYFFSEHIERQFLPGMTWENRDQWHIDHIIPLATAKTEADVIALNHFTNLRPLWAKDNLTKSDTVMHLI